jgi:hypothetical protein
VLLAEGLEQGEVGAVGFAGVVSLVGAGEGEGEREGVGEGAARRVRDQRLVALWDRRLCDWRVISRRLGGRAKLCDQRVPPPVRGLAVARLVTIDKDPYR